MNLEEEILNKEEEQEPSPSNVSVGLAAATTAYARIHLIDFKNLPENRCVYTDTDSVVMEKELDPQFVGKEMGQFKLEKFILKGFFVAPKMYALCVPSDSSDKDYDVVIKAKGLGELNIGLKEIEQIYHLIAGENQTPLETTRRSLKRDYKTGTVYDITLPFTITGTQNKRIPMGKISIKPGSVMGV